MLIQSSCSATYLAANLPALEGHVYCGLCFPLHRSQHFVSAQGQCFWYLMVTMPFSSFLTVLFVAITSTYILHSEEVK